jgi:uncharacterized membrane protein
MDTAKNLFKDNSEKDNAIVAVEQFIKQLKVPITSKEIQRKLTWQTNYPSLQSVKTFLSQIDVDSIIIEADKERLSEMPQTLLCHFNNSNGGEFRTLISHSSSQVSLLSMNDTEEIISVQAFKSNWSGIVLLAEKNENSGSNKFKIENRMAFFEDAYFYLIPSFIFLFSTIILFFNANNFSGYTIVKVFLLNIFEWLGLVLSILILKNSVDGESNVLNKLCFKNKTNKDCNQLFTSKGAFLFGISLSEIGFLWFASTTMYALFVPQGVYFLCLLFCSALLILPYSLFYQWRVAKQWCSICLLVMAIIFAQSLIGFSILFNQTILNISTLNIIYFLISFCVISLIWLTIKRKVYSYQYLLIAETNYHKLKYNKKIFEVIQQSNNLLLFNSNCGIVLRNESIVVEDLILIISLSCNPCSDAFVSLTKMVAKGTKINSKIIISFPNDQANTYYKCASILYSIFKNNGTDEFQKALNFWYNNSHKDFNKFTKEYSENVIDRKYDSELESMVQWNLKNNISVTPTWFINGKELDEQYSLEDISIIYYE